MSYLKDLPCASCGTESTYYFPDKPTAHYCYCEFRFEIGEQIAEKVRGLPRLRRWVDDSELLDLTEVLALIEGEK